MKRFIKSFVVTLVIVLAIGAIYLYSKDSLFKSENADGTEQTGSKNADGTKDGGITGAIEDAKKEVIKNVAKTVVDKAVEQYAGESSSQVKEMLDSVSEEDKDKVADILVDNMSIDDISDVQEYITNQDVDGLKEYAKDKLTEEDYSELTDILEKYSSEAAEKLDGVTN
ncbi:hypothetical protein [Butyrivibrio sp. AC2005]|uniref:hypothetical protein n=1 Tax=Butyrivibrio sp. AC2005 TaxID=1280672 RepID=UPI000412171B|nr:hypothetical protein [Butyrivibrio sp. AC2005]